MRSRILSLVALLAVFSGGATAQVVISEIMVNPQATNDLGEEWVELRNMSNTSVSLSNWCLFVSTRKTMGTTKPGNYYWPFPKTGPGSLIAPGGIIVVRWMKSGTNTVHTSPHNYIEVFTGTTVHDFLFGLYHYDTTATPVDCDMLLPDDGGAVGLVRTKLASETLLPGFWADFVEYGSASFKTPLTADIPPVRLPVKAGLWTEGTAVALPIGYNEWPISQSLAYSYYGNTQHNYWCDWTPTPGRVNVVKAGQSSFGQACACKVGSKGLNLTLPVPAVVGGKQFNFLLTNGIPMSPTVVFLSTGPSASPQEVLGCYLNMVNLMAMLTVQTTDATGSAQTFLFIPPNPVLVGVSMAAQYFLVSPQATNNVYCSSNGMQFSIGE